MTDSFRYGFKKWRICIVQSGQSVQSLLRNWVPKSTHHSPQALPESRLEFPISAQPSWSALLHFLWLPLFLASSAAHACPKQASQKPIPLFLIIAGRSSQTVQSGHRSYPQSRPESMNEPDDEFRDLGCKGIEDGCARRDDVVEGIVVRVIPLVERTRFAASTSVNSTTSASFSRARAPASASASRLARLRAASSLKCTRRPLLDRLGFRRRVLLPS